MFSQRYRIQNKQLLLLPVMAKMAESLLNRKHEWESVTKKAKRSWHRVFAVLSGRTLSCYKDQKHARSDPNTRIHREPALELSGSTCVVAADYTKRPHVFRLRLANGGEYLFQGNDDVDMTCWIGNINVASGSEGSSAPQRAQTLPARVESGEPKRDEPSLP